MKIVFVFLILLMSGVKTSAQDKIRIMVSDNKGNQLTTYFYEIRNDSLFIKGRSEREKEVDYLSRKLVKKEIKNLESCMSQVNFNELNESYKGDFKVLGFITASNFPRILELEINQKKSKINHIYISDVADIINCMNSVLPPEVKIKYTADQFLPKETNIEN